MGTTDSQPTTYDDNYNRVRRIKIDMIRVLRLEKDLDKDTVQQIIASLNGLELVAKDIAEHDSYLAVLGDYLPYNSRRAKVSRMERKIENITENELYIRLKEIQNKG